MPGGGGSGSPFSSSGIARNVCGQASTVKARTSEPPWPPYGAEKGYSYAEGFDHVGVPG